jgi:hypothetical protein
MVDVGDDGDIAQVATARNVYSGGHRRRLSVGIRIGNGQPEMEGAVLRQAGTRRIRETIHSFTHILARRRWIPAKGRRPIPQAWMMR